MAIISKVTQPGQTLTSSLNGQIVLDEGKAQLTLYDPITQKYRLVIGLVNGEVIIAISKPGEDVFAALDA